MSDSYPVNLEIEFDREQLRKYYRTIWFLSWLAFFSFFATWFSIAFGIGAREGALKSGTFSTLDIVKIFVVSISIGLSVALVLATIAYLIFSHWTARKLANSCHITIEGSYLRIRKNLFISSDRKLHFRAIVDYATSQGPMMRRFGIHSLQMTTTAGGQNSTISIPGVKDCLRVRDMLADIDRMRENS